MGLRRRPIIYRTFRDKMSKQMLQYDPLNRQYWGDAEMRVCTAQRVRDLMTPERQQDEEDTTPERARKRGRPTRDSVKARTLQTEFNRAESGRGYNSRLCGDLTRLKKHIKSSKHSLKHPKVCKVCGVDAYSMCQLCGVYLHFNPAKEKHAGNVFQDYLIG